MIPFDMAQSVASATPSNSRFHRIAEAFAERNLRLLLTANLCNDLAMWAYNIALGWLVFDLTGSPFQLGVAMSVSMVLMQTKVEDAYRGRVIGLYMLTFGLQYVAALPIGSIAEGIDTPATFILMGAITAIATTLLAIGAPAIRHVSSAKS